MHDDFIDFKSIHKFPEYLEVLKDKCQVVESGKKKKVMQASIKQVKFTLEKPEPIFFKYKYEDNYISVNFRTGTPKIRNTESRSVKSNNRLYEKPVGISKKKKDDLMKLCKKGYIPKHHHGFYEVLKCNDENDQDDDVSTI